MTERKELNKVSKTGTIMMLASLVVAIILLAITQVHMNISIREELQSLREQIEGSETASTENVQEIREEKEKSYNVQQLTDLCLSGQYDDLLEVCLYQETTTDLLCLATQKISENCWIWKSEDRDKALEQLTKLEMLILEHPNCNKQVLLQLMRIDNSQFAPILIQDQRNDSWLLMLWAESCRHGDLSFSLIIANHESANAEVLQLLIDIATEQESEEIKTILEKRLNTLQGT